MLAQLSDASGIDIGDDFYHFSNGGRVFQCGSVDAVDEDHIYVDFDDFRMRYDRQNVRLMEENCGYIRTYYASLRPGEVVERFI